LPTDLAAYSHLGCAHDGRPYVVPMNYAFDGTHLYFFTAEGMKTQFTSRTEMYFRAANGIKPQ